VAPPLVERYLELGLRLGRHLDGLVDAYYGPPELAARIDAEPPRPLAGLAAEARNLVNELDGGGGEPDLDANRRRWLRAQVVGLVTTADKLGGADVSYLDEVERCYGVRPTFVPEDEFEAAHRRLDEVVPGSGPLAERYATWRESQAVAVEQLEPALRSLADDFRERTQRLFGLPDGEQVEWLLETDKPWSGFNYYLGGLRSRVAINTDLPVLSPTLGHLVAHEAYPGHHTEHTRKEAGLVRRLGHLEETIFLVGTPQCLLAEGMADLGIEVLLGPDHESVIASHLAPLRIPFDDEVVAQVRAAGETLGAVRGNAAWLLHEDGCPADEVVAYLERWSLIPRARAEKAVQFLTDPTWRAYISCYIDGLRLCRGFAGGDPARFERLLTEQLVPADLVSAAA
jgi:hypothetical protein